MTDLTYDDVLLVPQYSDIAHRKECNPSTQLGAIKLDVPIISANMDTITGELLAWTMKGIGGLGILHRYMDTNETIEVLRNCSNSVPSIGIKPEDYERLALYREYTSHICIDIAHGHSKQMIDMIRAALYDFGYETIIAGNVATVKGAEDLYHAGANVIKIGIGPGSVCTTRTKTGFGVPQFSAVQSISQWRDLKAPNLALIADGGLSNSGDIVKALAAGANAVMSGYLFAGCKEALAHSNYKGMASDGNYPEGISLQIIPTGESAVSIVNRLMAGIRSGMSYCGARTLAELRNKAEFVRVSPATWKENGVRY